MPSNRPSRQRPEASGDRTKPPTTDAPAANDRGFAAQAAGLVALPVAAARRVLPDRELPVYLGMGALAVVGAIEWPVAAVAGVGYAVLRRWGPLRPAREQPG